MNLSKENLAHSLRLFKNRRDDLLHEDVDAFEHHLERFLEACRSDSLIKKVLDPLLSAIEVNVDEWWEKSTNRYDERKISFPTDQNEELVLRYRILEQVQANDSLLYQFGRAVGKSKLSDATEMFRTIVVRPLVNELTHRLADAADLATPEARDIQAVPLDRIPGAREGKIFLSHKSVDKPIVYRYYHALKQLGFSPWLDEPNMAAGANLERELLRGFEESCAAVFFITDNFKDENYLATEVDYAVMQKRKKGKKFAIITLRYPQAAQVPSLLTPYIYKDVVNDLEGFYEILRALPLEVGPTRWKAEVI